MIRTVIADDEVLARHKLRLLLQSQSDIDIVGEGASGTETIDLVRFTQPDLLFLDIRMPGMDGFDVWQAIASDVSLSLPRIVFTTAHDSYAIRAFEINAVDYLLKPFTEERMQAAVERVRQQAQPIDRAAAPHGEADAAGNKYARRIVFKSRGRIVFLPTSDIGWIGAEENYVRLCTDSETHLLRETMAHLEEKLDPEMFLRVHRSSIVNLQYIKEVRCEKDGDQTILLKNGQKVAMSRSYRSRIQGLMRR